MVAGVALGLLEGRKGGFPLDLFSWLCVGSEQGGAAAWVPDVGLQMIISVHFWNLQYFGSISLFGKLCQTSGWTKCSPVLGDKRAGGSSSCAVPTGCPCTPPACGKRELPTLGMDPRIPRDLFDPVSQKSQ